MCLTRSIRFRFASFLRPCLRGLIKPKAEKTPHTDLGYIFQLGYIRFKLTTCLVIEGLLTVVHHSDVLYNTCRPSTLPGLLPSFIQRLDSGLLLLAAVGRTFSDKFLVSRKQVLIVMHRLAAILSSQSGQFIKT